MLAQIDFVKLIGAGGFYFFSIAGVILTSYYAVRSFRADLDKLSFQTAKIEAKIDLITATLSEIQIKAAAHDAAAQSMHSHVQSIDERLTFLERRP